MKRVLLCVKSTNEYNVKLMNTIQALEFALERILGIELYRYAPDAPERVRIDEINQSLTRIYNLLVNKTEAKLLFLQVTGVFYRHY